MARRRREQVASIGTEVRAALITDSEQWMRDYPDLAARPLAPRLLKLRRGDEVVVSGWEISDIVNVSPHARVVLGADDSLTVHEPNSTPRD